MELLVVGGDRRYALAAEMAAQAGYNVTAVGYDRMEPLEGVHKATLEDLGNHPNVLLPIPWREASGLIPAPLSDRQLPFDRLVRHIPAEALLMCGKASQALYEMAQKNRWHVHDLYEQEAFAMANAVPSAEGAINAAMSALDTMLHGMRVMVVGYGRIGKVLAGKLRGLGAQVIVAARRSDARAQAVADMHEAVSLAQMPAALRDVKLVFSTPPELVLSFAELNMLPPGALVLDLASPPYGVDLEAASALSVRAWRESGLPGRYCPRTAARLLMEAVYRAIAQDTANG